MKSIIAAAFLALLIGASSARATTLLDTIGGETYNYVGAKGWTVGNLGFGSPFTMSVALGFSTPVEVQINAINAFIGPVDPLSDPDLESIASLLTTTFTLSIMMDVGGTPSGELWSRTLEADSSHPVLLNDIGFSLGAGHYFLVASAPLLTVNSWQYNPGQAGAFTYSFGDGDWHSTQDLNLGDFYLPAAIISTDNISAVPLHPSNLPSLLLGSAVMGWMMSRRRAARIRPSDGLPI